MSHYPILKIKLYAPPLRPELVSRPRLIARLNAGLQRKLTLVSAPAGFGKTMLISEWTSDFRFSILDCGLNATGDEPIQNPKSTIQNRVAWLSLDEGDSDLTRFLAYLVAALQTVAPAVGEGVLAALQSPQPPPLESMLTALLNEIAAIPGRVLVVLDDYHLIDTKPTATSRAVEVATGVDQALTFLLDHLPPQMHLVIATRENPPLPLARYRAQGQLTELRAADLRFSPTEAAEFLNRVMGLELSAAEIAALEARTEGWIAGLQLAALSMQGRRDVSTFIQSFTGSHHFVLDYLVEEVLQRQPESVQAFLLCTSILDRLCGPLCDALLEGWKGGRVEDEAPVSLLSHRSSDLLAYLERANLFVVPLDDERRWYRYHHLFGAFLRQRLYQGPPANYSPAVLHSRASLWCERNGDDGQAFHHAVAAGDLDRAAGLAELAWQKMDNTFQSAAWLGWVRGLPDELVRARPLLSTEYAWALMDAGELEASESRLRDAERWLEHIVDINNWQESAPAGMVVVDGDLFRTAPAKIAMARAYHAQARGDHAATARYARLALDLSTARDYHRQEREAAAVLLGVARWAGGDLAAAHEAMLGWIDSMRQAGTIVLAIASAFAVAEIETAQGHLRQAAKTYRQALELAAEQGEQAQQVTAHHALGLAMVYHEQGDRPAAARQLLQAKELGERCLLVDWPCRWRLAQARLKEAEGELDAALALLDEAERLYVRIPMPDLRPLAALRARVWIKQGRLAEAWAWVHEQGLTVGDEISYLREFEQITLARLLLAGYRRDRAEGAIVDALTLLERLLRPAEESGRTGSAIEILVLQALAHEAQGNIAHALAALERAVALAEPEGYVRVLVDEGAPIADMLARMDTWSEGGAVRVKEHARKVLAAFAGPSDVAVLAPAPDKSPTLTKSAHPQRLVEPLSERELQVLRLVALGLSNREIGERLFLALDTVKGHNRRIFAKLQVQRRTEAVARARELGLL